MEKIEEILELHKEILQESPEKEILPAVIGLRPDGKAIPTMIRPAPEEDPMKLLAAVIYKVEALGADEVYVVYTGWFKPGVVANDYRVGDIALAPDKRELLHVDYYHLRQNKKRSVLTEIRRRGGEVEFGDVYRGVFSHKFIDDAVEQIRRKKNPTSM